MLLKRIFYFAGEVKADLFIFSVFGHTAYTSLVIFKSIAKTHKIASNSLSAISENLFKCLPFID